MLFISSEKIAETFGTLQALLEGMSADNKINSREIEALKHWIRKHYRVLSRRPFDKIIQTIENALTDNSISDDELKDIKYLCQTVMDTVKPQKEHRIQKLHGIVSGIAADGHINSLEWTYLKKWINKNRELRGSWPFDEIRKLTKKHSSLKRLSNEEKEVMLHYLNDFCGLNNNDSLTHPLNEPGKAITEITGECPDLIIPDKTLCLTGNSEKFPRQKIVEIISNRGGRYSNTVSKKVDYLVICGKGSVMWKYSCYGRKVEGAIALKNQGHPILIVPESDLWKALG